MGVSPRSRELDSRGNTARRGGGSHGAALDASVRGARRIRGARSARRIRGLSGVLSNDEGRSKGENGESGESEHGVECGVGVICKGRMELDIGLGGLECKQEQHAAEGHF